MDSVVCTLRLLVSGICTLERNPEIFLARSSVAVLQGQRACRCMKLLHPILYTGLPLMSKKVYQREQDLAAMRDAKYGDGGSFKDESRQQRLSIKRGTSVE